MFLEAAYYTSSSLAMTRAISHLKEGGERGIDNNEQTSFL